MSYSLKRIRKPIEEDLKTFESYFRDSMKSSSNVPLLDRIMYYIVKRKGKQVRPIVVFLSASVIKGTNDATFIAASLVELLHTATLVHDDVVDDANYRRGFFSIKALWKNKIAVLVGDYLLSQGLLLAIKNKEFKILEIVSNAVKEISEGELLQLEKARKLDIEESVYYQIIKGKTASLIAAACAAGAASVTKDEDTIEKMRLFGEKIGISFQIRDDLFDYGTDDVGKPLGIDIKEKKMTLPLIYALSKADKKTQSRIVRLVKRNNGDKKKINQVIDFVISSGGLEYAKSAMLRFKEEAFEILDEFPNSESKEALVELVNYIVERKK
jgi:octaprenyl-diphosphate synthase